MKKFILIAALVAASSSGLLAELTTRNPGDLTCIGGWDFNSTTASNTAALNARYNQQHGQYFVAGAGTNPGSATFGTAYFTGSNGATFASNRSIQTSEAPKYDLLSTVGLLASNNSLGDFPTGTGAVTRSILLSNTATLDNARATFKVSTLNALQGFKDVSVAYSARNGAPVGTGPDATISWSYSLDGISFTSIAGSSSTIAASGTAFNVFNANLSSITALNNVSTLWLGLDYSEAAAGATTFLDNVAVYAVAIPEPSTYAAILGAAVVGVSLLRRRKAALVA